MTKRELLVPNECQLSRLLVALTINRSPEYQIKYGTGKDVSNESIANAKGPLVLNWLGESTVTIPITR